MWVVADNVAAVEAEAGSLGLRQTRLGVVGGQQRTGDETSVAETLRFASSRRAFAVELEDYQAPSLRFGRRGTGAMPLQCHFDIHGRSYSSLPEKGLATKVSQSLRLSRWLGMTREGSVVRNPTMYIE